MLIKLPIDFVLEHWRPGSFDRTWKEEFQDLGSSARIAEMQLRTYDKDGKAKDELAIQMLRGDDITPITLGWDRDFWQGKMWIGRMWAGHHTIWLHWLTNQEMISCDVVEFGEKRPWPACHCAPPKGCLN
jgi:hypothetical protein